MSAAVSGMRHVRGMDLAKPFGLGMVILLMLPLILLPLASIFIFGTSSGLKSFWAALTAPDAVFALKLSLVTSFWATVFNVVFGLFAAYVLSRYAFFGRTAIIVTISAYEDSNSRWQADRTLATIQSAVTAANYTLERFHLPRSGSGESKEASGTDSDARHGPGVLLFRRSAGARAAGLSAAESAAGAPAPPSMPPRRADTG